MSALDTKLAGLNSALAVIEVKLTEAKNDSVMHAALGNDFEAQEAEDDFKSLWEQRENVRAQITAATGSPEWRKPEGAK